MFLHQISIDNNAGFGKIAQKNNSFSALNAILGSQETWVIDSEASNHMMENKILFQKYNSYNFF